MQLSSICITAAECKYDTCERETLAVVFAFRRFRVYLLFIVQFTLERDLMSLKEALLKKGPSGKIAHWMVFRAEYEYTVRHKKRKDNAVLDFLIMFSLRRPFTRVPNVRGEGVRSRHGRSDD